VKKRSAPNRSQGREEKMQAASFFASWPGVVKILLVALAVYEVAVAAVMVLLLRVLREGAA
jgi:hypothetical protein